MGMLFLRGGGWVVSGVPADVFEKLEQRDSQRRSKRGNSAAAHHPEFAPAPQKSPQPAVRLAQKYIGAAGMRQHGGQFRLGQRAAKVDQSADHPQRQNQ